MAGQTIEHAKEEQDKLYRHLKSEERDAGGSDNVKKTDLMKRRALRRAKAVRVAINKFWQVPELSLLFIATFSPSLAELVDTWTGVSCVLLRSRMLTRLFSSLFSCVLELC